MIRNMCLSYYKNNLGLIHAALWLLKKSDRGGGGRAMAFKKMGLGEGEGLWLLERWDWRRGKGYGF